MSKGWISIHRQIMSHWLYPNSREFTHFEAWIDLLLEVNHQQKKVLIKGSIFVCKRGESVRSLKEWGRRWGWGKSRVHRFLELLKKEGMIELKNETITTRISVCNYEKYQKEWNADETQMKRRRNASETQADTNNNDNNENKENKSSIPSLSQVEEYFVKNGYKTEVAKKAYNIYSASLEDNPRLRYWRDSRGNIIRNWKQKMQSVWFTEENRTDTNTKAGVASAGAYEYV